MHLTLYFSHLVAIKQSSKQVRPVPPRYLPHARNADEMRDMSAGNHENPLKEGGKHHYFNITAIRISECVIMLPSISLSTKSLHCVPSISAVPGESGGEKGNNKKKPKIWFLVPSLFPLDLNPDPGPDQ